MVRDYDTPNPGAVLAALRRIVEADPGLRREAQIYALLHKTLPLAVDVSGQLEMLGATSPDAKSRAVEAIERAFLAMNGDPTNGCCGKE